MTGNGQYADGPTPRRPMDYRCFTPPALQSPATSDDLVHVATIKDFMAPEFHLPLHGTYASQLEISDDEDPPVYSRTTILGAAAADNYQGATIVAGTPRITTQDKDFNDRNEPPYISITRPWEQQLPGPQGTSPAYGNQAHTPFTAWESQGRTKEPFNNIGEVAVKPVQRQQDGPSDQDRQCRARQTRRDKR